MKLDSKVRNQLSGMLEDMMPVIDADPIARQIYDGTCDPQTIDENPKQAAYVAFYGEMLNLYYEANKLI